MCYQCHDGVSVAKQYAEMLENNKFKFDQWNTTSIGHLIISMSDHDGKECKDSAIKVYKKFLEWYEDNKEDNYFPNSGMEQMYSQDCLKNILEIIENNSDLTSKEITVLVGNEIKENKENVEQVSFMNHYEKKRDIQSKNKWILQSIGGGIGLFTGVVLGKFLCNFMH